MLIVVDNKKEIKRYIELFRNNIKKKFGKPSLKKFAFPGGGKEEVNLYHVKNESRNISIGIPKKDWNERYVHLININPSEDKTITPDVEINFPFEFNKNTAGCFVKNTNSGNILLCHRGKFNAFQGMIPLKVSKNFFKRNLLKAYEGKNEIELIPITQIDSPEFVFDIYIFTEKVLALKKSFKGRKESSSNIKNKETNWWDNDEFEGLIKKNSKASIVEYNYLHGEIKNRLTDFLTEKFEKSKYSVKSNKNIDLALLEGKTLISIFEIKTSGSFSDQLYKAIGQLICYRYFYANEQNNTPKLILVLPKECYNDEVKKIMKLINIIIILYNEGKFILPDGNDIKNTYFI